MSDPFDAAMRHNDKTQRPTSLGLLIEVWGWYRLHQISCGRALYPVMESIRQHLMIEAPQHVKDVERIWPE